MNPVSAHVARLAREVLAKLGSAETTLSTAQAAIDGFCPDECPRTKDRILDYLCSDLGVRIREERPETSQDTAEIKPETKRVPKPKLVASSRDGGTAKRVRVVK